jgi:hypothetical protein
MNSLNKYGSRSQNQEKSNNLKHKKDLIKGRFSVAGFDDGEGYMSRIAQSLRAKNGS